MREDAEVDPIIINSFPPPKKCVFKGVKKSSVVAGGWKGRVEDRLHGFVSLGSVEHACGLGDGGRVRESAF